MPKLINLPSNDSKFEIKCKNDTSAEIFLYAAIGDSMWGDAVSANDFSAELNKLPKTIKNISLRVNSPGGSVFDGMTIFNRLKQHPAKVTAYVDGVAASIASIIIMAADEIVMGEGSYLMIHKPMSGTYGNSIEHERTIDILDKIENQMISIYAKKVKLSRTELSLALASETWYGTEQAIENGFADKVATGGESLKLAASAINSCKWFKNAPDIKNKNDFVREKIREFNSNINKYLNKK